MRTIVGTCKRFNNKFFILATLSFPEFTIGIIVFGALFYKIKLMQPAATSSIFFAVVQHDAPIFSMIFMLYYFGICLARRHSMVSKFLAKLCFFLCLSIVFLYLADVFAYYFFTTRLYVADIVTFSSEMGSALTLLKSGLKIFSKFSLWKIAVITLFAVIVLHSFCALIALSEKKRPHNLLSLTTALLLMGLYLTPVPGYVYSFGDKPLFENFIERNANFFNPNKFSERFRAQLLSAPSAPETCKPGRQQRLNVLLLVVESLSAYHSRFFSGVRDWTPRLDEIAATETALTNFHANGWTTIGGLVALLTRTFPFVPEKAEFNKWGSPRFADYDNSRRSLARELTDQGYTTEFIAAGDLSFLGQDNWLREMGFQKLVGNKDSRFSRQEIRGPFNSVPDRLLYDIALDELSQMPVDERPHFIVIQTYWSHRPFMAPDGGSLPGEEWVIRETDAQIGLLYERLLNAGYFENGLLFITGDHRAMEPFHKAEFDRFGNSAIARVPGVVVTRAITLPKVIDKNFQQRDFGASIMSLIANKFCLQPFEGSFLTNPPTPGRCIMHSRGDDRDLIYVKCDRIEGTIRVQGDETRLVNGVVENEASVIHTINLTRMRPAQSSQ